MEIKKNFDRLSREARELLDLKIEEIKLSFVERLSLLFADTLSWLAVIMFLLLSLLCMLAAFVVVISLYVGLLPALFIATALLLVVAWLFYAARGTLFRNVMVARFYRMFFNENEQSDEQE